MDILFENSYTKNLELAKEIYRYYYFKQPVLAVCQIMLLISFVCAVVAKVLGEPHYWSAIILVPLIYAFVFYNYCRQVNNMVNRDKELYGKEVTVTTAVTADHIQCTSSTGDVCKLYFDSIRSTARTENLILCRTKANLICIFRKDAFTKGSEEEFIAFMRNKGIRIK